ncbi:MAG: endolytic transglycosylase MltG [Patescibacteria group bacterium]
MTEELDPTKYHVITPQKKRTLVISLVVLFLVIVPALLLAYYKIAVWRPSQSGKEVTLEIGSGNSVFEIADTLASHDAINSEFLFILYVFLNRGETNIQAGTYTIKAGTPLVKVIEQLQHGKNDITLTFLEGWRREEFARLASQKLEKVDYKEFLDLTDGLEGYLFPDTYFVNKDIQDQELVSLLRETFDQKTSDLFKTENLNKVDIKKENVIILASMVEREVSNEEDRPIIAGILIKRWKEGMKLDVDATTQYAVVLERLCSKGGTCIPTLDEYMQLEWWPEDLSKEELEFDSPYNTRLNVGLPPAPISSVSVSALSAILNYKDTPYYFYLTDKAGVTHYAKTLAEHNANIAQYLVN